MCRARGRELHLVLKVCQPCGVALFGRMSVSKSKNLLSVSLRHYVERFAVLRVSLIGERSLFIEPALLFLSFFAVNEVSSIFLHFLI